MKLRPLLYLSTYKYFLIFFTRFIHFILGVGVLLHICLCTVCVLGAHRGHKRALDQKELELWMIVNYHVYAGNQTWVLYKNQCS